ncbi:MAG: DUF4838 domain-containing protein [Pedobacter sp.]|uniref:DUF4838 domain-containing protein n=1 Tax=Pedobacter sp. TaxID=1411316 RepID=UPI0028071842|nr:DUF4838 domain-containing protein [Pedobacter sp.]MDQ8005133.1 DUF4838 domain-containing protein [Pedobacter sp.]
MQTRASLLVVIVLLLMSSCAKSNDFVIYKRGEIKPVVYYPNGAKTVADEFVSLFRKLGEDLSLSNQSPRIEKPYISLKIDAKIDGFKLQQTQNGLLISAGTEKALKQAIYHFFGNYTNLNQFIANTANLNQEAIAVPLGLDYTSDSPFSYKEPYFAENFDQQFRLWNNTNTLEESWALWGHNIGKLIKVTPKMYAIVDGEPNEEQLNFSSVDLQKALERAIEEKLQNEPSINKFMIMPYDNDLVCNCELCLKEGNSRTNASPAVFALIDRLAAKFPKASFYSTAYVSTEKAPQKPARENVGVMISTMSFPKGIVIERSNKAQQISQYFKSWQNITKNIYLWDYAINFDNYFEFYPTASTAQRNLQFYIKNGVNGIFMHGSDEGSFAAFGNLKSYLYAQMLSNPDADLKKHINLFLENTYPTVGKELATYYISIEEQALKSNKTFDIYGGTKLAVNKYLKYDELDKIFKIILAKKPKVPNKEYNLLLMSFVFQKLELLRINGFKENGYATYQNQQRKLNPEIQADLSLLKQLSITTGISRYNEIGLKIGDYINAWNSRIVNASYQNLLYGRQLKVNTDLDEEYSDVTMLNDGALGFEDYYNNWLLNSSAKLAISANTEGLQKASTVQIDFLYDKKHKIYPPEKVSVYIGDRKFETVLGQKTEPEAGRKIIRAIIPVKINANDTSIKIEITKQSQKQKRSFACDEIIIK